MSDKFISYYDKLKEGLGAKRIDMEYSDSNLVHLDKPEGNGLYKQHFSDIEFVNRAWRIHAEDPIFSQRKLTGRFIVFGKKIVRKLLRWLTNQTTTKVSYYNTAITRILIDVVKKVDFIELQNNKPDLDELYKIRYEKQINEVLIQLEAIQKDNSLLKERLEFADEKLSFYKEQNENYKKQLEKTN